MKQLSPRSAVRGLSAATFFSTAGQRSGTFALALYIYARTHSGVWLSISFMCTLSVSALLAPVGGYLSDRYLRQRVSIVSDLASMGCWLSLSVVGGVVPVVAVVLVASVSGSFAGMAIGAAIPDVVTSDRDTAWAYSVESVAANGAQLAGPAIGAAAYTVGGFHVAVTVSSLCFGLSSLIVLVLRAHFNQSTADQSGERELLGGFREVRRQPVMLGVIACTGFVYVALNTGMVADLPLVDLLGAGTTGYLLIDVAFGVSVLLGGFLARHVRPGSELRWYGLGAGSIAVCWTAVALPTPFPVVLVSTFVVGTLDAMATAALYTLIRQHVSDAMRARVIAVVQTVGLGSTAAALSGSGWLVDVKGPRFLYGCAAVSAFAGFTLTLNSLRHDRARAKEGAPQAATVTGGPAGGQGVVSASHES